MYVLVADVVMVEVDEVVDVDVDVDMDDEEEDDLFDVVDVDVVDEDVYVPEDLIVVSKLEYLVGWSLIIGLGFNENFFDEFVRIYLFP